MADSPIKFKSENDLRATAMEKLRLHYDAQIRSLLKTIREQNQKISALKSRIEALEASL